MESGDSIPLFYGFLKNRFSKALSDSVKSRPFESPTYVRFPDDPDKVFPGVSLLVFLLAEFLQDQVILPVIVYSFFSVSMVSWAQVYFKSINFAFLSIRLSKIYMMVLYQLFSVVPILEHAEIALLTALVLQDTLLFLRSSHSQLSTMMGSSYLDLWKQAEYPLALMSSLHSSRFFRRIIRFVGLPVFPSNIRTTYLSGYSFGFL